MNPKDLASGAANTWCPGCGNFSILAAIRAVLSGLDGDGYSLEDVVSWDKAIHVFQGRTACSSREEYSQRHKQLPFAKIGTIAYPFHNVCKCGFPAIGESRGCFACKRVEDSYLR